VHVEGQLTFNTLSMRLRAARAGLGIVFAPEDIVQADISAGRFVRVLSDWCRRHSTPAFSLLVEALRYRGAGNSKRK